MKIKDVILQIEDLSFQETLEYLTEKANKNSGKTFVVTINPEIIMLARQDAEYEKVLKSADLALADGVGVIWAGKMFGKRFKGRVQGSDLVENLSRSVAKEPITVGFLGGKQNVAITAAKCLREKYPELKVAFTLEEWPSGESRLKCDILFVAFGSPKQEKWIYENLQKINVKVAIGVGGAFDYHSGLVMRAPKFMRDIGLEWLFRLIRQPWRIRRQLRLIKFVYLIYRMRIIG